MFFSLKRQRNDRKNALAVAPEKGKTGEKAVFSPHCGDETTTYHIRSLKKWDDTHSIIEIHYLCMECIPYKNVGIPYSTQYCRRILANK